MNFSNISITLLRLAVSYIWLSKGITKLFDTLFITTFQRSIVQVINSTPYEFYSIFLKQFALPNAIIIAQLGIWTEILAGVAFLLGFPLLIAIICGIFLNVNYFFASLFPQLQLFNVLMIFAQLAVYGNSSRDTVGIKFGKK